MSEGVKHDTGKAPMSLLSTTALRQISEVLAFGAKKYAPDNWRGGMAWRRLIDASLRHLTAFADGENTDPESGLPHLAHAACCLMFLQEYQAKAMGTDDRFQPAVTPPLKPEVKLVEHKDHRVGDMPLGATCVGRWSYGNGPEYITTVVEKKGEEVLLQYPNGDLMHLAAHTSRVLLKLPKAVVK